MKKRMLILLSLSLVQPLIASEQINSDKQHKKSFWTKTKIGIAAASAIVTTTIVAFFGHRYMYGEKQSSTNKQNPQSPSNQMPKDINALVRAVIFDAPVDAIKEKIAQDKEATSRRNLNGETPFMVAVKLRRDPEIIKVLSQGYMTSDGYSIVNTRNNNSQTSLNLAVDLLVQDIKFDISLAQKDLDIIKTLVELGIVYNPGLSAQLTFEAKKYSGEQQKILTEAVTEIGKRQKGPVEARVTND